MWVMNELQDDFKKYMISISAFTVMYFCVKNIVNYWVICFPFFEKVLTPTQFPVFLPSESYAC